MTNSMQATLSKAVIYTKQPTREWGDLYLTWGCANVLLREIVWEWEGEWERETTMNVGLVLELREEQCSAAFMYESLWELYEVLWELYESCW